MRPRIAFIVGAPLLVLFAAGLATLLPTMRHAAPSVVLPPVAEKTPTPGFLKRQRRNEEAAAAASLPLR